MLLIHKMTCVLCVADDKKNEVTLKTRWTLKDLAAKIHDAHALHRSQSMPRSGESKSARRNRRRQERQANRKVAEDMSHFGKDFDDDK